MVTVCAQVSNALPRVLSLFQRDRFSGSYGIGDRQHVSWCTKDFANGTQQGAAHGLARLLQAGLLPSWCSVQRVRDVVESAFMGTASIMRRDGSLEEAFPYESSFCVTALGLHDLLWAYRLCPARNAEEEARRLACLAPLAHFLYQADEYHGMISNHLATAAGALYLWSAVTSDSRAEQRAGLFLQRILRRASSEGWFSEYGGADPGYQSLCMHYLALLHSVRPDLGLLAYLARGMDFLSHFVLPDGSFGGVIGSRRTRCYYPTAAALLAQQLPLAACVHAVMNQSMVRQSCVTLCCMDDDNLIPMFNAYAVAATVDVPTPPSGMLLPCQRRQDAPQMFPEANMAIYSTAHHYTVVALGLGGAYESASKDGSVHATDGGSILQQGSCVWSTQCHDPDASKECTDDMVSVRCRAGRILRRRPTPFQLLCLRLLAMTVMRLSLCSRWIKRTLAYLLMRKNSFYPARIERCIYMGGPMPRTVATLKTPVPGDIHFEPCGGNHCSIHMASVGYWQSTE